MQPWIGYPVEPEPLWRLRHAVYAAELGQYAVRADRRLPEPEAPGRVYIAFHDARGLGGFVALIPPGARPFGLERYLDPKQAGLALDATTWEWEVRALTVAARARGSAAALLLYAALREIKAGGGRRVVAMGREAELGLYTKLGLEGRGTRFRAGEVGYELLVAEVASLRRGVGQRWNRVLEGLLRRVDWALPYPPRAVGPCEHGGGSAAAREEGAAGQVISADVLEAWFPPAPEALDVLSAPVESWARPSPLLGAGPLRRALSETRGVPEACLLPGGGSSALIFAALGRWLRPRSRVLIPDPTYGEYAHLAASLMRCRVERLELRAGDGFALEPDRLGRKLQEGYDRVFLANPNSPTGRYVDAGALESVIQAAPHGTVFWVDETYVDSVDGGRSLERFAVRSRNVIVCKFSRKSWPSAGCAWATCAHQNAGSRAPGRGCRPGA